MCCLLLRDESEDTSLVLTEPDHTGRAQIITSCVALAVLAFCGRESVEDRALAFSRLLQTCLRAHASCPAEHTLDNQAAMSRASTACSLHSHQHICGAC